MAATLPDPITEASKRGEDGYWSLGNPSITVTQPETSPIIPLPNPTFTEVGAPALVGLENPIGLQPAPGA